jgi:DNA primase
MEYELYLNPMPSLRELLKKVDIVDVISSYIELRQVGNNYVARCPFHQDDTPSFYVSPSRGIFKCFGCGVGGDAIKFVSMYENVDYKEALLKLAQKYKIPLKLKSSKEDQRVYVALQRVADFYHEELKLSKRAFEYLKERRISSWAVNRFFLGYGGETSKLVKILRGEGLLEVYEKTSNLNRLDEESYRDLFKNRLVIPIRDLGGRFIAFGGRSLGDEHPKYVNSPESEVFKKRYNLFGLYEAKEYLRESAEAIIVEGYFDVISMHQEDFRNCVAPLGTSLTLEQGELLSKLVKSAVLLYDGDSAGRRAVKSSVPNLLRVGLEVKVVYLPEGEDPDSFIKKDVRALRELLSKAKPLHEELLNKVRKGEKEAFEELLYYCSFISDGIKRYELLKELSSLTNMPLSLLEDRLPKVELKTKKEKEELSYHEAVFLAGVFRFGFESLQTESLRLSPQALELLQAIKDGNYHLLPDYVKNLKLFNFERAFEESLRALSLSEELPPIDFESLREASVKTPRKLRIKR